MDLSKGILRPGTVMKVLENGNIKATAPGLFSMEDIDNTPPIMPFFGNHANTFSAPHEYDEVWILNLSDNPRQLFWFRKDDFKEPNADILKEENVEVLCNRESGLGYATIYFSDGTGWIIKNDDSKIQIRKDGTILLDSHWPHRVVDINADSISLGSEGSSAHPAALGDAVEDAISTIQNALSVIKEAAGTNAYTKPIAIALGNIPNELNLIIPKIASNNVTLD